MSQDLLSQLRAQLDSEAAKLRDTKALMHELRLAIAAIEGHRAADLPFESPAAVQDQQLPRKKRGAVMKLVLDCIREGNGSVQQIKQAAVERGLELSPNSISNTISRLQRKKLVRWDSDLNGWACHGGGPRDQEMIEDQNAEGSEAFASEPSQLNGATGTHPLTTALHSD